VTVAPEAPADAEIIAEHLLSALEAEPEAAPTAAGHDDVGADFILLVDRRDAVLVQVKRLRGSATNLELARLLAQRLGAC
jgi:hypothetical protein